MRTFSGHINNFLISSLKLPLIKLGLSNLQSVLQLALLPDLHFGCAVVVVDPPVAMLLVVLERPYESISRGEVVDALPVLFASLEIPVILLLVGVAVNPFAIELPALEVSLIVMFRDIMINAITVFESVFELTVIPISIQIIVNSPV